MHIFIPLNYYFFIFIFIFIFFKFLLHWKNYIINFVIIFCSNFHDMNIIVIVVVIIIIFIIIINIFFSSKFYDMNIIVIIMFCYYCYIYYLSTHTLSWSWHRSRWNHATHEAPRRLDVL